MIFITGDLHGDYDIHKLTVKNFPEQKEMTKDDYLIICGDFGLIWDNSRRDLYWRRWLNDRKFTTLFVDGNHENFDLIEQYPITNWKGGKIQLVDDNIIHLMRGQVYTINGYKFFTMGGGTSVDRKYRKEGKSWWQQEQPSTAEYDEAIKNLDKHNWKVDYVISHTTSTKIMNGPLQYPKEDSKLNNFFDFLETQLDYKYWYFGHFHYDKDFPDYKCSVVYTRIIRIK